MPKFTTVVGIRLTPEEVAKLDWLAVSTNRPRPDVMRALIQMAKVAGMPDMLMDPLSPTPLVTADPEPEEVSV